MSFNNFSYRRAVVMTADTISYQAVRAHLNNLLEDSYKDTIYEWGIFSGPTENWVVGIAQQIRSGNAEASSEAERAITYFQPTVVLFVGTAYGLGEVQIGDVVVANKVYGYESGKASKVFEPHPEIGQPTHALEQRAMAESKKLDWWYRLGELPREYVPRVHIKPLAAGEKTIDAKDSITRQFLQQHYADALALELEGYGFFRALYANQHIDALIVRGIFDSASNKKEMNEEQVRRVAARHASAFAFEVLAKFQPHSPQKGGDRRRDGHAKKTTKIRVLAAFACPLGTQRLRVDAEERVIKEAIELSKQRGRFLLKTYQAATIRDLSRALLNEQFNIVHIAGHGNGRGLVLAREDGGFFLVDQATLVDLFRKYAGTIRCVILNSCYSLEQGLLLSQIIPFTIAMEYTLDDQAAIKFTEGFYDALGAGHSIDSAYIEGNLRIKFAAPQTKVLPRLIKQGELLPQRLQQKDETDADQRDLLEITNTQAIIGIALDLSASMHKSIANQSGERITRVESVRQSLKALSQSARRSIRENGASESASRIDIFIYGFGLRSMGTCDVLSLLEASKQIITEDLIRMERHQLSQEMQGTQERYAGVGPLLRQWGLGTIIDSGEEIVKHQLQDTLRKRIWQNTKGAIEQRMRQIGDTTLPIDTLVEWWGKGGDMFANIEEIIFGKKTPIAEALQLAIERFEKDLKTRDSKTKAILFLLSDGKYTTTNPAPLAEKLRAMGVIILSCLITDKDVHDPRYLLNQPQAHWSPEARLMFDMASTLDEGTNIENFLLRKGWTIYPQAKLFVQVNHSDILNEFTQIMLSQLETPSANALPPGR